ncbi:MAG: metallopeptidase family protein [Alphaproteobacteria bacterium]|nr:metallopeptidase family protein [Alphaproteobacteria bacterium]
MTNPPRTPGHVRAPSLDKIAAIAEAALADIPIHLRHHTTDIVIAVEELCTPEIERDMELDSPFELLGLYQGRSLDSKSSVDVIDDLDRIMLYRRAILDFWSESGETLEDIVRNVMIHEIGHHFGLSDDDMEALENAESTENVENVENAESEETADNEA